MFDVKELSLRKEMDERNCCQPLWQPLSRLCSKVVLQLRFDFNSTVVRLLFDCNSTTLRSFDDLPCDSVRAASCRRAAATICLRPLHVANIFVFIRQMPAIPACWLFRTPATSWPLTFWSWNWCPSHVWCGLPLCQFWSS